MNKEPERNLPFAGADQDALAELMADVGNEPEEEAGPEVIETGGPPPVEFTQVEVVDSLDAAIKRGAGGARQNKTKRKIDRLQG